MAVENDTDNTVPVHIHVVGIERCEGTGSLLSDGVRVLTRSMRKITGVAGAAGTKLRDRSRSVKWRVLEIGRAARGKAAPSRDKLKAAYGSLLRLTGRVVGQAKRFSREIGNGVKRGAEVVQQMP